MREFVKNYTNNCTPAHKCCDNIICSIDCLCAECCGSNLDCVDADLMFESDEESDVDLRLNIVDVHSITDVESVVITIEQRKEIEHLIIKYRSELCEIEHQPAPLYCLVWK